MRCFAPRAAPWGPSPEGPQGHPAGGYSSMGSSELLEELSSWAFAPGHARCGPLPLRSPVVSLVSSSLDPSRGPSFEVPPGRRSRWEPSSRASGIPPGKLTRILPWTGEGAVGERTRRGRAWISVLDFKISLLSPGMIP